MHQTGFVPSTYLEIDGLANFRDVGGLPTPRGPVRPGRLYRSDGLNLLSSSGRAQLERLGCTTVIDLRTTSEVLEAPGPVPVLHLPLHEELVDLPATASLRGHDAGVDWLQAFYELMIVSATAQFSTVLRTLARPTGLPAIVHCAGGKDRTGITIALILSALEVPRDVVLDDYAQRSGDPAVAGRIASVHARFIAEGIDPEVASALLSAPRRAMEGALRFLDVRYGGIDRYLGKACAVDRGTVDDLRARLVVAGA